MYKFYRYYSIGIKGKKWSSLDRWPDPPKSKNLISKDQEKILKQQLGQNENKSKGKQASEYWNDSQLRYCSLSSSVSTR